MMLKGFFAVLNDWNVEEMTFSNHLIDAVLKWRHENMKKQFFYNFKTFADADTKNLTNLSEAHEPTYFAKEYGLKWCKILHVGIFGPILINTVIKFSD